MKKHFLLLLMAFMSITTWAAEGNITIMPANVQYVYGDATIPTQQQTATANMISIINAPERITKEDIAAALYFKPNTTIGPNVGQYSYSLLVKPESELPEAMAGYNITISGGNGQLSIVGMFLSDVTITAIADQPFTGSALTPTPVVSYGEGDDKVTLVAGQDFNYSYANNTHVGTADITITAVSSSNYTGTQTAHFNITKVQLASVAVAAVADQTYNLGTAITPALTVTGTDADGHTFTLRPEDYTVNYGADAAATNKNVGTATGTLTAAEDGDFTFPEAAASIGQATFTIVAKDLNSAEISIADIDPQTFNNGAAITPVPAVNWNVVVGEETTANPISDFVEFEYSNNTVVGTATIIAKPKAVEEGQPQNYTGQKVATFTILPASIAGATISFIKPNPEYEGEGDVEHDPFIRAEYQYEGREIKPGTIEADGDLAVTMGGTRLEKGVDYEIVSYGGDEYDNTLPIDVSEKYAAVTIKGLGNYDKVNEEGEQIEKTQIFEIAKRAITLTAVGKTTTYGVNPDFEGTANFVEGEDLGIEGFTYKVYNGATEVAAVEDIYPLAVGGEEYTYKAFITYKAPLSGLPVDGETGLPTIPEGKTEADYASAAQMAARENYDWLSEPTQIAGTITVTEATLIIVPKDVNRKYGSAEPTFDYDVYKGSVVEANKVADADKAALFTTRPTFTREEGNDVKATEEEGVYGYYTISVANPPVAAGVAVEYEPVTATGYTIECQTGKFTITPFPITIKANDQTILFDSTPNLETGETSMVKTVNADGEEVDGTKVTVTVSPAMTGNGTLISRETLRLTLDLSEAYDGSITEHEEVLVPAINNKNFLATPVAGNVTVLENPGLVVTLDDADENLVETINTYAGVETNVSVKLGSRSGQNLGGERKWVAGQWNTLVLPFDISVADLSKALGYAIVNVIDNVDLTGDKPVFKFKLTMKGGNGSETVLKANRPFTLKTSEDLDITKAYNFGKQTIVAPTANDAVKVGTSNIYFKGTYETKAVSSADNGWIWFLMGNYANGWAYIKSTSPATTTWNIVPFAGYIDMSAQGIDPIAASRAMFVMEEIDGTTTAIKGVDMDSSNVIRNSEGWYNLNGMKMQSAPTQKGVYIQNGKKVVVK